MQLILVGASFKTATLNTREKLAFHEPESLQLLAELQAFSDIHEVVLLSTCNRTEIYALTEQLAPTRQHILDKLSEHKHFCPMELEDISYTYYNKFAAEHLFQVAAGLDSMVIGESEILKQVKDAWKLAHQAETSGTILNALFKYAIHAGKRVRTETNIGQGCTSVGALTAQVVRTHYPQLAETQVVLVGAGQISQATLKYLREEGVTALTLINRSQAKMQALQVEFPELQLQTWHLLPEQLRVADVVIVCTASEHFVLTQAHRDVLQQREKPLLLVDLAVPRNVDPALGQVPGITLMDMEYLQTLVAQTKQDRLDSQGHVHSILADEMSRYLEWFNTLEVVPTIDSMYQLFDEIRQNEIKRGLQKYAETSSPEVCDLLDRVTRAITQKILHYPVVQLKMEKDPSKKQNYTDVLTQLFKLDAQDYMERYLHHPKQTAPLKLPYSHG